MDAQRSLETKTRPPRRARWIGAVTLGGALLLQVMIVVTAAIHLWLIFVPHKDDDGKSII